MTRFDCFGRPIFRTEEDAEAWADGEYQRRVEDAVEPDDAGPGHLQETADLEQEVLEAGHRDGE
jgi:hypothetical protein